MLEKGRWCEEGMFGGVRWEDVEANGASSTLVLHGGDYKQCILTRYEPRGPHNGNFNNHICSLMLSLVCARVKGNDERLLSDYIVFCIWKQGIERKKRVLH